LAQNHRYEHCVRVARCADVLAQRHGLDARKARVAGMLHDLARLYAPDRLIAECERRGLPIGEYERRNPVVLHARLGSALAAERYGVTDTEILSAIAKHTTADDPMSPLDCAVYVADSTEPGRTFAQRAALWELAMRDLREATRQTLRHSLAHLRRNGTPPAPQTAAAARALGIDLWEAGAFAS
jgi:predicted HD superfamily hydrolase involved in NAD metabolism